MLEKVSLCNDCLRNAGILIVREIIKVCDVNIIGTCSGIICLCDFNDLGINLSKRAAPARAAGSKAATAPF